MAKIALLIGVGQFDSQDLAPLPKSSADVDAMKEALIDSELGGFAESNITMLKNPHRQQMEDAIYDLFDKNKRDRSDLLLFYFSGHGIIDESGTFYFSTSQTRKDNGKLRHTTAISSRWVHQWIDKCRSKRIAIILDCCHSGAFTKGMSAKGIANAQIQEQLGGEGRAILTAASATEYAWAKDELNLSAYTHYLLEGVLTGKADQDGNSWLSMEELHDYASRRIKETGVEMTPEFYPVREGAKIRLFKVRIIDPKQRYRKEIKRYVKRGEIPSAARYRLEILCEKIKISPSEAQLIEAEVFAPIQQKKENLKKYETALREFIAEEDSFNSDWIKEELRLLQQALNLEDNEVKSINEKIIEVQLQQKRQEYQSNLKRYKQEFTKAIQKEYPLNNYVQDGLKKFQQSLKLTDEDATQIEQPILDEAETKYQEKLQQQEAEKRRQEAERVKYLEREKQRQSTEVSNQFSSVKGKEFEFETVRITGIKKGLFGFNRTVETKSIKKKAEYFTEDLGDGITLEMVAILCGTFMMGTEDKEIERLCKKFNWDGFRRESPQHKVTVQPFYMSKYPITQAQWKAIAQRTDLKVKENLDFEPSYFKENPKSFSFPSTRGNLDLPAYGDNPTYLDRPVEQVNWYQAKEFCDRLSQLTGKEYRLPSEAEWEYACRADPPKSPLLRGTSILKFPLERGTSDSPTFQGGARGGFPFYFGETITSDLANYRGRNIYADEQKGVYRRETTPVGMFPPNAFGLYDLHGNVWEWCADTWHDNYQGASNDGSAWITGESTIKILRGGSWNNNPYYCCSASRSNSTRANNNNSLGFRVVCESGRTI